jgi:hypothetical protein
MHQMLYVAPAAGEEVIDAQHVVPALEKTLAEMRTKKSGTASDHCTLLSTAHASHPLKPAETQTKTRQNLHVKLYSRSRDNATLRINSGHKNTSAAGFRSHQRTGPERYASAAFRGACGQAGTRPAAFARCSIGRPAAPGRWRARSLDAAIRRIT